MENPLPHALDRARELVDTFGMPAPALRRYGAVGLSVLAAGGASAVALDRFDTVALGQVPGETTTDPTTTTGETTPTDPNVPPSPTTTEAAPPQPTETTPIYTSTIPTVSTSTNETFPPKTVPKKSPKPKILVDLSSVSWPIPGKKLKVNMYASGVTEKSYFEYRKNISSKSLSISNQGAKPKPQKNKLGVNWKLGKLGRLDGANVSFNLNLSKKAKIGSKACARFNINASNGSGKRISSVAMRETICFKVLGTKDTSIPHVITVKESKLKTKN